MGRTKKCHRLLGSSFSGGGGRILGTVSVTLCSDGVEGLPPGSCVGGLEGLGGVEDIMVTLWSGWRTRRRVAHCVDSFLGKATSTYWGHYNTNPGNNINRK